jgi:hypothetical protein
VAACGRKREAIQGDRKGEAQEDSGAGGEPPHEAAKGAEAPLHEVAGETEARPRETTEVAEERSPGEVDNATEAKTDQQAEPVAKSRGPAISQLAPQSGKSRRRPRRDGQ